MSNKANCGKARAVEIQKRAKRKKRKGRKECFESGMKMLLRIGEDSDQAGRRICLKWNGITSLLKIGGRMLRYVFCPIFINEEDLEISV